METFWAMLFKPVVLFLLLLVSIPVTIAVRRHMKEGKLKRLLLHRWK